MKKVLMLFADGFEEIEAVSVIDILRRAGASCDICSVTGLLDITGSHKIKMKADILLENVTKNGDPADIYDCLVIPGGLPGSYTLRDDGRVTELFKKFYDKGKFVCAICAAPAVLEKAGLLKGRNCTSYPDMLENKDEINYKEEITVRDGNLITSRGAATAPFFAFEILEALGLSAEKDKLSESMMYNFLIEKLK